MMMLGFQLYAAVWMDILRDDCLEEFFGDELEALEDTLKREEASAPCRGVRVASIHLRHRGMRLR